MMWDYDAFPLWEDGIGNVEGEDLPISATLAEELQAWSDEMSNARHPPTYEAPGAEWMEQWDRRGRELLERFRHELGPGFQVGYYSEATEKVDW